MRRLDIADALAAAALLGATAAGAQTYHGHGYSVTTRPVVTERVYVYEYPPQDTVVYYSVPRQAPLYDARDLTPYEADRYFGHPGNATGVASVRDSNPTDHATGIYNPQK